METQSNKIDFSNQNIYAGFDVHLKSWKVTILTEKVSVKTFSQDPKPELLYEYLKRNFPGGIYHSAYEAGFCGYWIHNKLISLGINSIVVNPADIPTTNKERVQKEDKRDSKKIARSLRSGDLNDLDSSGFVINNSSYDSLKFQDIVIQQNKKKFLRYPEKIYINFYAKSSDVTFLKNQVYFTKNGYFDSQGLLWQGEMALYRIADQLPFEYILK